MEYQTKWNELYEKIDKLMKKNDVIIENLIMSFDDKKGIKIAHYQKENATLYKVQYLMETME